MGDQAKFLLSFFRHPVLPQSHFLISHKNLPTNKKNHLKLLPQQRQFKFHPLRNVADMAFKPQTTTYFCGATTFAPQKQIMPQKKEGARNP
jgi:hypothetical protein